MAEIPVVRAGLRWRVITYHLAEAAVDHARAHGASALEGYPLDLSPARRLPGGRSRHRNVFVAAGFDEVHLPSKRRAVMRISFDRAV
jgi:hypothetical protein